MDKQPVSCPECGAPEFGGRGCPTCHAVRTAIVLKQGIDYTVASMRRGLGLPPAEKE